MKVFALVFIFASAIAATAADHFTLEVLASDRNLQNVDVPARAFCNPGANGSGLNCAYRGAQAATVGTIRVDATIRGESVVLWCSTTEKHCFGLKPGSYTAEPKGKDRVTVFAWANPIYNGDLKKATKVELHVGH